MNIILKHGIVVSLFLLLPLPLSAKNDSYKSLSDSLSENAYAIIEDFAAEFVQTDLNNATYKVTKAITILDKKGEQFADFYLTEDKFRELKEFSGVIKNAMGIVVKKIVKKDLIISTLSDQMASDGYTIIYNCKYPTYPYTVEYTYQEKWKNGIISYPPFVPTNRFMQSVRQANYTIEIPSDRNLQFHKNFNCEIKENTINGKRIYTFSTKGIKAIDYEPLSPAFRDIAPYVLIAPSDFCYDAVCGNMSSWSDYGLWVSGLLKGRDVLPDDLINKLKALTQSAKDDKEKTAIIYKYLQDNTRYVSIQLGIGGLQPIEAASVTKTSFGDCKGLSNLMKAMLKTVDIESNYCEISMNNGKYLYKDFANVSQTDHAILLVPLKNDSIWLECTSQTLPFGYIHDDIAGHDALVITDKGGKICRLPVYNDDQNRTESNLVISISENGSATGTVSFTEHLHGYGSSKYYILSKDREKEMHYINTYLKLPKIKVNQISTSENRSEIPSCNLSADFEANDFANITGARLFVPICPLSKGTLDMFSAKNRKLDIEIDNGHSDIDTITFQIPESYTVETLPKDIFLKTPYGVLKTKCVTDGNKVIYTQSIDIFSGKYDNSKYEDIKKFFSSVSSALKRKAVFKKI